MEKIKPEILASEQQEDLTFLDLVEKVKENPIELMEEKQIITTEELKEKFPGKIIMVDAYIKSVEEKGRWDGNAFSIDDIINLDHHAPVEEFERNISSTNLAIGWVKKNGIVGKDYRVVINHTDCDSVLAALIMRGVLPPDEKFGEAAIAADHTGAENEIADLLQSLEDERDLEFSAINLQLFFEKKDLEPKAQELLEKRYADREKAKEAAEKGKFAVLGGVSYVQLDKKVDSGFFPALIPDAQVILVFSPHKKNSDRWEAKIRLGMAAPAGLTLNKLKINDFDSSFGNRWNAGSNIRSTGTSLSIEDYAKLLNEKLQKYLDSRKE